MSDSEEDVGSISKQKSIFSGMGRVKQINHLWSPKSKPASSPDRSDAADSSPSPVNKAYRRRSSSSEKSLLESPREGGRRSFQRTLSTNSSSKRLAVEDLERYLAINTWLEHNGIDVTQVITDRDIGGSPKERGLLDEMYSSLETLESAVESELAKLNSNSCSMEDSTAATSVVSEPQKFSPGLSQKANNPSSPALFDYLTVIGADVIDITTRNYWNQRENVFEATVAFAHPPESQFYAESMEHFCFPAGVRVANVSASPRKDHRHLNECASPVPKAGDFFVLMLSGGGVQGQNVQRPFL
ncbi:hypothetical protein BBJ29_003682 [Phytophthora kernoviae]|uniref:Uncharacterized protein n=1 Tax=Phytophthora kernoviae TaxID=325452 RepID=A0A3F2RKZ7_9STRA|nr:hypothetical protein BBJ29_003682 [Phytophthora kernoviae]RLN59502.1 hypothetical protein BBP00_00006469 [Phytophthora kernoviae]